ncbi:uncharacterized protein I303_101732 [Kwoniella dejecticola CBS 10117]|uniref:Chromatin binding protein n=1 Tax=Kwoniella dejecticola CBS 10117 TaxID=1296121 RepID=A0A1A6ACX0_9TREE|nr:chromatin binding protein [Kwoniella dejecticola CBS 10117]OBR87917.1 chromatin binding protein [Kwoniella dejecticola CBS 10117]
MAIPPSSPIGIQSNANANAEAGPSSGPKYLLSQTLSAHNRAVTALRFSNDGQTLVSAGADGWLHYWKPDTGDYIRGFQAHKTGINDISISPDSLYISTASDDSTSSIYYLHPPPAPLTSSSIPTSSSSPSSPSPNDEVRVAPLRTLIGHTAPVLSIAFSPKSNLLVTGSYDESAIIWDVKKGKILRNLPAHADAIWCVAWDNEGAMVLTASSDGLIRLWDVNTGQCLKTLDNDTNSPVSHASFTPSSYFLLSSTLSSTLRIYNIHTSKVLKTIQAPGVYVTEKFPCPALIFAPPDCSDNPSLSSPPSPDQDQMEVDQVNSVNGVNGHIQGQGQSSVMTSDGQGQGQRRQATTGRKDAWIIAGSENGKIVIWDLQSKSVMQVLEGHTSTVVALAVHPSGRIVASGSLEPERSIKLWRVD